MSSNNDTTPSMQSNIGRNADLRDHKIIIAAGTYDGVLAGYILRSTQDDDNNDDDDNDDDDKDKGNTSENGNAKVGNAKVGNGDFRLRIILASPCHSGSIRAIDCYAPDGKLVSSGYDELLQTHDLAGGVSATGVVRTPSDYGTPVTTNFCVNHCLVGFQHGQLLLYHRKRDWSVQHVLQGHEGGVSCAAVHPNAQLAVTGGVSDSKVKCWDLERGRLAYSMRIKQQSSASAASLKKEPIVSLVWNTKGTAYGFCYGSHVTVKDVASGTDLLDVDLPSSRVNQMCLMQGPEGMFVAAACNDGSLAVLAVDDHGDTRTERRAIMAIEPVDGPVAGEERFKCIQPVFRYYVATANSAGVISLMNLQGAVAMITTPTTPDDLALAVSDSEHPVHPESDEDSEHDEGEQELAVDIVDSAQLGAGARITCLAVWVTETVSTQETELSPAGKLAARESKSNKKTNRNENELGKKRKDREVTMDHESLERARALVSKAKKIQKKKSKKQRKVASEMNS